MKKITFFLSLFLSATSFAGSIEITSGGIGFIQYSGSGGAASELSTQVSLSTGTTAQLNISRIDGVVDLSTGTNIAVASPIVLTADTISLTQISLSSGVTGNLSAGALQGVVDLSTGTNLSATAPIVQTGDVLTLQSISLSTGVTGSLPAASVAAGSLGASVMSSSAAASTFQTGVTAGANITITATASGVSVSGGAGTSPFTNAAATTTLSFPYGLSASTAAITTMTVNGITYHSPNASEKPAVDTTALIIYETDGSGNVVESTSAIITDGRRYSSTETYCVSISTWYATWDSRSRFIGTISSVRAATIQSVTAWTDSGTSLAFNIEERAAGSENSAGTDIKATSFSATPTSKTSPVSVFSNASIAANASLYFDTDTSAESGTVEAVNICVSYTETP